MKDEAKVKKAKRRMEEYGEKQKKARGSYNFQEGAPSGPKRGCQTVTDGTLAGPKQGVSNSDRLDPSWPQKGVSNSDRWMSKFQSRPTEKERRRYRRKRGRR